MCTLPNMTSLGVSADDRRRHRLITRLAKAGVAGLRRRDVIRCGSSNERKEFSELLDRTLDEGLTELDGERWRLTKPAASAAALLYPPKMPTPSTYTDEHFKAATGIDNSTPEPAPAVWEPEPATSFWQAEYDAVESTLEPSGFWS